MKNMMLIAPIPCGKTVASNDVSSLRSGLRLGFWFKTHRADRHFIDRALKGCLTRGMASRKGSLSLITFIRPLWLRCMLVVVLFGALFTPGPASSALKSGKSVVPREFMPFIVEKEAQARELAKKLDLNVSPDVWAYFRTAQTESIPVITNAFEELKKRSTQYEGSRDDPGVGTPVWQTVIEVQLVVDALAEGTTKYAAAFAKSVIESIPRGSIYFGGTDPGRGLVTAFSTSHSKGDPFFTLTQNALADGRYLQYLRAVYGEQIRIPTPEESQKAFHEYLTDVQKRFQKKQLRPGEDIKIEEGRVQVSGQVAVMTINGLLVKVIFDRNAERQFYVEESFPLDWMYRYLSPHGFVFKLNREPLDVLPDKVVKQDRAFWTRQQKALIGNWLTADTSVQEVGNFVEKTFGRGDLRGFKGDRTFVQNNYANKMYSKLRASIGGMYHWRGTNATSAVEGPLMLAEADFALKQAFALCPRSQEAVFRYINLLVGADRLDDALQVGRTAQTVDPNNAQLKTLMADLARLKSGKSAP
jgi:hypothetical protein